MATNLSGKDTLIGGRGRDILNGGSGDDLMRGGDEYDKLLGGTGNDTLYGDTGSDELIGGDGLDILEGGKGNDTLRGGKDNDRLTGAIGDDLLRGEAGNDTMFGNAGNDTLQGGLGRDMLKGGDGNDTLFGDADNDTLLGGKGVDQLTGGDGDDLLRGGAHNDELNGGNGNDSLYGNGGADEIFGNDGADFLSGGSGNDILRGGNGNDRHLGGAGYDEIFGGSGNDTLDGQKGVDRLFGNEGADIFILGDGADFVGDFSAEDGDVIDISAKMGSFNIDTHDINDFIRVEFDHGGNSSTLLFDANGRTDGVSSFKVLGTIDNNRFTHAAEMINGGYLDVGYDRDAIKGASPEVTASQRQTASAFNEFLGVGVVLRDIDPGSAGYNKILNSLDYIGIDNIRVKSAVPVKEGVETVYDALADEGIQFNFLIQKHFPQRGAQWMDDYVDYLADFVDRHPDAIKSFEGLNEVGNLDFSFEGSSTKKAAADFQKFLYASIKSESALEDVPVANFTVWLGRDAEVFDGFGDLSNHSDLATAHVYMNTKLIPYYELINRLDNVAILDGNSPAILTETGLPSNALEGNTISVDETVQAKSVLNMAMNAYKQDVHSVYLYELLDEKANDPTNNQSNFGLFKKNGTPKEVAHALHNLTSILEDDGNGAFDSTTPFEFDISGGDGNTHAFALNNSNGDANVIIWRESIMWDRATGKAVASDPLSVDVSFDRPHGQIALFDPLVSDNSIRKYSNRSSVEVELTDHVVILEIDGANIL
ncbi:calcium-binding protein [Amaricoccus tamworthensis]|uniref:calcium-binding protein n=1 Tax=Amaricoccus tamworthensis TaxID=57002 RepID=UPI003C7BDC8C